MIQWGHDPESTIVDRAQKVTGNIYTLFFSPHNEISERQNL